MTKAKSFWKTLPGMISAVAALLTAITGLIALFIQTQHSPTHDDRSKFSFSVETLADDQEIFIKDFPVTVKGRYTGEVPGNVWIVCEDELGGLWLPGMNDKEVRFFPDGRWSADIWPALMTRYIHFRWADAQAHEVFLRTAANFSLNLSTWPNGSTSLRVVPIKLKTSR